MAHLKLTPGERRTRLLGHAIRLAEAQGIKGVTCANVAAADNATGPLVNRYFGTRDALRWEVITEAGKQKNTKVISEALKFGYATDDLKAVASATLLKDAAKL